MGLPCLPSMGLTDAILRLFRWLLPSGVSFLLLFLRARLNVEFEPISVLCEKSAYIDWNVRVNYTRIRVRIENSGIYTAEKCTVSLESITKDGTEIFHSRQPLQWDSGGTEPCTIFRGSHRGRMAVLCYTEKGREPLKVASLQLKEDGVYEFKLRADSPELLTSPGECSIAFRYIPFSGELEFLWSHKKPWYKKWW